LIASRRVVVRPLRAEERRHPFIFREAEGGAVAFELAGERRFAGAWQPAEQKNRRHQILMNEVAAATALTPGPSPGTNAGRGELHGSLTGTLQTAIFIVLGFDLLPH